MARAGEYVTVDLDENNAHTRRAWAERHPGEPQRSFGWGVCRMGHGLLDIPALAERQARELAEQLNGVKPRAQCCGVAYPSRCRDCPHLR